MKVLVIGATGGAGREAVGRLMAEGHEVTAFSRRGEPIAGSAAQAGDALDPSDVEQAVRGQDAVVVTLGISEDPLRVRLFGPRYTSLDVRSRGTRQVIAAMHQHGVRRLVVLSSYGVGSTRKRLRPLDRLLFAVLLAPQIADTERQEEAVRESGLDWVIAQPVHLSHADDDGEPFTSSDGAIARLDVSRKSLARFLARAVTSPELVRRSVAISGPRPAASRAPAEAALRGGPEPGSSPRTLPHPRPR